MFILFGHRATKVNSGYPLHGCTCPSCKQQNCVNAYVYSRYFHIFFIPIFPLWKSTEAECMYCRLKYNSNMLTPEMYQTLAEQKRLKPAKRPLWHWLGLLLTVPVVLLIVISSIIGITKAAAGSSSDEPDYHAMLRTDLDKCVANPSQETDSVSHYIKGYVDLMLVDDFDGGGIKYYSRSQDGKLLVLLKIDKMKSVEKETRKEFMEMVKSALTTFEIPHADNAYIGIHGRWNMCLSSSPTRQDLDGDFADEDILYGFYQKSNTQKEPKQNIEKTDSSNQKDEAITIK